MNRLLTSTTALSLLVMPPVFADMEAANAFLDNEIDGLSVLTREEQEAEMQFFVDAAQPFQGMEIKVVSETITTHEYESQVLAPAFSAITGIQVTHDLIGEGDVVEVDLGKIGAGALRRQARALGDLNATRTRGPQDGVVPRSVARTAGLNRTRSAARSTCSRAPDPGSPGRAPVRPTSSPIPTRTRRRGAASRPRSGCSRQRP